MFITLITTNFINKNLQGYGKYMEKKKKEHKENVTIKRKWNKNKQKKTIELRPISYKSVGQSDLINIKPP